MSEAKLFIKTAPDPVLQKKMNTVTLQKRSKRIWKFLEKRRLIQVTILAEEVGYDKGNFWRYWKGKKKLPQDLLLKVEKVLEQYGLNN
jgi:hypothetical protein